MSGTVEVIQQTDVALSDGPVPIVIVSEDDIETIYVGEQGPPDTVATARARQRGREPPGAPGSQGGLMSIQVTT